MAIPIVYTNADQAVQIKAVDANGDPILYADASEIVISVYQSRDTLLQQFKKTAGTIVGNDTDFTYTIFIDKRNLSKGSEKRTNLEVSITVNNEAFPSGYQTMTASDIPIFDLKKGVAI